MAENEDATAVPGLRHLERVEAAIAYPGDVYRGHGSEGFNIAGAHILTLLEDATAAYERGSLGTATFLAITAIEETAKAELMIYRRNGGKGPKVKGGDPLRSHTEKHGLTIRDTTFMSERLVVALGDERCKLLHDQAQKEGFGALREAALYVAYMPEMVIAPREAIERSSAREMLLLAIEAADDILVGYTDVSFDWAKPFEALFRTVA